MSALNLSDIAIALRTARDERKPMDAPTKTWTSLDAEGGFQIQKINSDFAINNGDRLVGYKLGNIAKVMQVAFGLDHPDYGFLHASTFSYEGSPFISIISSSHIAVDYVVPAIEIIDSRVKNWAIDLPDTLADNGSNGGVILGGTPKRVYDLNLSNTRGVLRFNGEEVMSGNTRNVLGNPLAGVAWLANRLAEYDIEFQPGQIILPGSCLEAVPMEKAGRWSCEFEGWGTIEFDVV
ncbi:unnamed protein product [Penicillium salamii]|nr:unnamed protein product [Penicillium salamii]